MDDVFEYEEEENREKTREKRKIVIEMEWNKWMYKCASKK